MRNFSITTHPRHTWLTVLLLALLCGNGAELLRAQDSAPAPTPAPAPATEPAAPTPATPEAAGDPAKQQDLMNRFKEGRRLYDEKKYAEARTIFDGILADEPKKAKGSLFYGGLSSLMLGENQKAVEYLERFRAVDAKDPRPVVHLIQAYQSLKKALKVESLRRELYAMRTKALAENPNRDNWDLGRPEIRVLLDPMFVRERMRMQGGVSMEVSESFNYKDSPNAVYMAQIIGADGKVMRNIYISYDPDQTAAIRKEHASEPKYKNAEVFVYSEIFTKNEQTDRIEVYRIEVEPPTYDGARRWILDMLARPPKSILTINGDTLRTAAERSRPGAAAAPASAPGATPNTAASPATGTDTSPIALPPSGTPSGAAPLPAPAPPGTKRPAAKKPGQP
ncbi:MAG: tol-pal system YbgF family protein [Candidatus Methylacidiphilales bacterium]|nr:tetratricopeptide repeat protein [Candidatus Methylacidiphilales bacterium]